MFYFLPLIFPFSSRVVYLAEVTAIFVTKTSLEIIKLKNKNILKSKISFVLKLIFEKRRIPTKCGDPSPKIQPSNFLFKFAVVRRYFIEIYLIKLSIRILKIKPKIKPGLNKVVIPFFFN
jgi:hypothetical protein